MECHWRSTPRHFYPGHLHFPHQSFRSQPKRIDSFRCPHCVCPIRDIADERFNRVKESLTVLPATLQALLQAKVSLDRLTTYLNQPEIDPPMGDSGGRIICQQATIGWPTEEKDDSIPEIAAAFTLKGLDFEPPKGQMTIVCGPLGSGKTLLVRLQRLFTC